MGPVISYPATPASTYLYRPAEHARFASAASELGHPAGASLLTPRIAQLVMTRRRQAAKANGCIGAIHCTTATRTAHAASHSLQIYLTTQFPRPRGNP